MTTMDRIIEDALHVARRAGKGKGRLLRGCIYAVTFGNGSRMSVRADGVILDQWEGGARPKVYSEQFNGSPDKARAWIDWFWDERAGLAQGPLFTAYGLRDPGERR